MPTMASGVEFERGGITRLNGFVIALALLLLPSQTSARKKDPQLDAELAQITARGRLLAEYHAAALHAADAVRALHPQQGGVAGYVAKKMAAGWSVAFGALSPQHDKFLIVYEATQNDGKEDYSAERYDPPKEDTGFFFSAARAIQTAAHDFQGERRPYRAAVIPGESNQLYVYIYPAQATAGVYPYGGDVRWLISSDGSLIAEKRQMHKTILEYNPAGGPKGAVAVGGWHSHFLTDLPEDTDVMLVLTRNPTGSETIGTKSHTFVVNPDGSIQVKK